MYCVTMNTRSSTDQKLERLLVPDTLSELKLPTYLEVLKYYLYVKKQEPEKTDFDIRSLVTDRLCQTWSQVNIPIVLPHSVQNKLKNWVDKYDKLYSDKKKRTVSKSLNAKIDQFIADGNKLFDIAKCQYPSAENCECTGDFKIPANVRHFLDDQRQERKLTLLQARRTLASVAPSTSQLYEDSPDSETQQSDITSGPSNLSQLPSQPKQMRFSLPNLMAAMDRTGVSQRNAAILANAVLQDVNLITPEDTSMVIDRNKILREHKIYNENLLNRQPPISQVTAIYFDGRKDSTLVSEKKGDKFYRREIREEHVTLLQEPNEKYLTHVTPSSSTAKDLCESIYDFLLESDIDMSTIDILGCDGTPVNTGSKHGVIRQMELKLGRSLQWFICQIHANELPLRHLVEHYDGRKTGPSSHSGPISKALVTCESLPVVKFEPVQPGTTLPEIDARDLSKDQQYLLEISRAVQSGVCPEDLVPKNPGPLSHSRWLTTANRLLRLYIGTSKPNVKLRNLVAFIMKVYVPVWFSIRTSPKCHAGAPHVFLTISLSRELDMEVRKVIDPVIQRNAFFVHPENLLLAMMVDERLDIRIDALRKILDCRKSEPNSELRVFKVPEIQFDATDYKDLIKWENITEPPIIRRIPDDQLTSLIMTDSNALKQILDYPCHTQAVERHVKLVTEASSSVFGYSNRHSRIISILESRKRMPNFSNKQDFVPANG